jgi:GT2 family glycosyltransferase
MSAPERSQTLAGDAPTTVLGDELPSVSFVVATLNEQQRISECLWSLLDQDYPAHLIEIAIVDGGSTDRTRDVVEETANRDPRVRLLHNPGRIAPVAFNIGIKATTGDIVSLVSAHSRTDSSYARRLAQAFTVTGAGVVGGRAVATSSADTATAGAIVRAMSSPFGVGNARFRHGETAGWVDTAFPGAYRRSLFEQIGPFDERLQRNQDDELHLRARRAGYGVWFDPALTTVYYPRATLTATFRQYLDYGRWRWVTILEHRSVACARHLAPAALTLSLAVAGLGRPATPGLRRAARTVVAAAYGAVLSAAVVRESRRGAPRRELAVLPAAVATLHLGYGIGFWRGVLSTGQAALRHRADRAVVSSDLPSDDDAAAPSRGVA